MAYRNYRRGSGGKRKGGRTKKVYKSKSLVPRGGNRY